MPGLFLFLAFGLLFAWTGGVVAIHRALTRPPRRTYASAVARGRAGDPGELNPSRRFESWSFHSRGVDLPVWDITGENPAGPIVIMSHGWGDSRIGALQRLPLVIGAASRVIAWDMPGHGEAPGSSTLGVGEVDDLLALIAHLREPTRPIALFGWSLGAGVSIAAAARLDGPTLRSRASAVGAPLVETSPGVAFALGASGTSSALEPPTTVGGSTPGGTSVAGARESQATRTRQATGTKQVARTKQVGRTEPMGGVTANILGVIAEAPYRVPRTPAKQMLRALGWPAIGMLDPALWVASLRAPALRRPREFDRARLAGGLVCPLLVLHGEYDEICPVEDGREIAAVAVATHAATSSAGSATSSVIKSDATTQSSVTPQPSAGVSMKSLPPSRIEVFPDAFHNDLWQNEHRLAQGEAAVRVYLQVN